MVLPLGVMHPEVMASIPGLVDALEAIPSDVAVNFSAAVAEVATRLAVAYYGKGIVIHKGQQRVYML